MCPHKYVCKYTESRLSGSACRTQEDFIFCSENIWFSSWILFQSQNQFEFEIPQCIHIIFLLDTKLYLNGMWIKIQGKDRQSGANPNSSAGCLAKPQGDCSLCDYQLLCALTGIHLPNAYDIWLSHRDKTRTLTHQKLSNIPPNQSSRYQLMHSNNAELSLNTEAWLGIA